MRSPCTTFPDVPAYPSQTPARPLPEITSPLPTVLFVAPYAIATPCAPLPRALVPVASRPIWSLLITLFDVPGFST